MTGRKERIEAVALQVDADAVQTAAILAASDMEAWLAPLRELKITDEASFKHVGELHVEAQTKLRELEDRRDSFTLKAKNAVTAAKDAYDQLRALWDTPLRLLREFKAQQDQKLSAWRTAERRRRDLEAEKERQRQLAAQEKERLRLRAESDKLRAKGLEEAADRKLDQAAAPAPVVVAALDPLPKVKGLVMRTEWTAKVTDVEKLGREWMMPNQAALDDFAKRTKGAVKLPGVEFCCEESTGSRRSR